MSECLQRLLTGHETQNPVEVTCILDEHDVGKVPHTADHSEDDNLLVHWTSVMNVWVTTRAAHDAEVEHGLAIGALAAALGEARLALNKVNAAATYANRIDGGTVLNVVLLTNALAQVEVGIVAAQATVDGVL